MKKILIFICLVVLSVTTVFSQEIGEKASKEVVIDGQNVSKMMSVTEITMYDEKGNKIQEMISVDESYEDIQIKGDDLVFTGNRIENHKESWNYYEYEYWKPGKIKKRIKYSTT